MTDRRAYNSTLRPVSKKRMASVGYGKKKPKPRKRPSLDDLMRSGTVSKASTFTAESERTKALKAADAAFSKLVRYEAADPHTGILSCFICGKPVHWKEAVLMHCEPRRCMSTRFDRINCKAGCAECNNKPNGDRELFRKMLDEVHGEGTALRNERASKATEKVTTQDLQVATNLWRLQLQQLETSRNRP